MIRLDISEKALETGEGLDNVVKQIFWYQIFFKEPFGQNIELKKMQREIYNSIISPYIIKGIDYQGKFNWIKPLCDTATSTFIKRVPDIVSRDKKDIERISRFTLIQKHNDFEEEITDSALQSSITGSGYLCLYADNGDIFPKYRSLDPVYTNVVYDCSVAMKKLCAYTIYYEKQYEGNITGRYICLVYTKDKIYAYYTNKTEMPIDFSSFQVFPLMNFFMINNLQKDYSAKHGFNGIPIVEFFNNKECNSDCKPILGLACLYEKLQNNRIQNVEDLVNYLLLIKNARLGNEEETNEAMTLIEKHRVLALEGDNVDARFLSNPLNQKDIQTLIDDIERKIHTITRIPDLSSVDFSQNASDPIIKIKTKPLLDLCTEKEKWFNKGYMEVLRLTLDFVERNDKELYSKTKFNLENVDLVYSHTLPSNDTDMVNNIVNLKNSGMLNPEVALQGLSFIPNVDEYLKGVKEYNDEVDKRKEKLENNNKNGAVNEYNIALQNAKPQTRDQEDNIKNATKGQSEKLSEDKE